MCLEFTVTSSTDLLYYHGAIQLYMHSEIRPGLSFQLAVSYRSVQDTYVYYEVLKADLHFVVQQLILFDYDTLKCQLIN